MTRTNSRIACLMVVCAFLFVGIGDASAKPKKSSGASGASTAAPPPPPTTSPSASSSQITQDLADLKAAETTVDETFETSSEWVAAQVALKQAQSDYADACAPVEDTLKTQPAYTEALDTQTKADANLKDMQTTGSPADISDAAQGAMQARSTVKALENKALLSDPGVASAKQRQTAAFAAVAELRSKEQDAVHADPTWMAAKKKLDADRGK